MALGGRETSGRVRGIGYGYFPDAPELAKVTALDRERWQKALDGIKTCGPVRGIGYGYFPESPELAKKWRCRKVSVRHTLEEIADEAMAHLLAERALQQGLPTSYPTPLRSSSTYVEGFAHGSPSPVDDITVSIAASTICQNSTCLAY